MSPLSSVLRLNKEEFPVLKFLGSVLRVFDVELDEQFSTELPRVILICY
jgi:hypothetical protein